MCKTGGPRCASSSHKTPEQRAKAKAGRVYRQQLAMEVGRVTGNPELGEQLKSASLTSLHEIAMVAGVDEHQVAKTVGTVELKTRDGQRVTVQAEPTGTTRRMAPTEKDRELLESVAGAVYGEKQPEWVKAAVVGDRTRVEELVDSDTEQTPETAPEQAPETAPEPEPAAYIPRTDTFTGLDNNGNPTYTMPGGATITFELPDDAADHPDGTSLYLQTATILGTADIGDNPRTIAAPPSAAAYETAAQHLKDTAAQDIITSHTDPEYAQHVKDLARLEAAVAAGELDRTDEHGNIDFTGYGDYVQAAEAVDHALSDNGYGYPRMVSTYPEETRDALHQVARAKAINARRVLGMTADRSAAAGNFTTPPNSMSYEQAFVTAERLSNPALSPVPAAARDKVVADMIKVIDSGYFDETRFDDFEDDTPAKKMVKAHKAVDREAKRAQKLVNSVLDTAGVDSPGFGGRDSIAQDHYGSWELGVPRQPLSDIVLLNNDNVPDLLSAPLADDMPIIEDKATADIVAHYIAVSAAPRLQDHFENTLELGLYDTETGTYPEIKPDPQPSEDDVDAFVDFMRSAGIGRGSLIAFDSGEDENYDALYEHGYTAAYVAAMDALAQETYEGSEFAVLDPEDAADPEIARELQGFQREGQAVMNRLNELLPKATAGDVEAQRELVNTSVVAFHAARGRVPDEMMVTRQYVDPNQELLF